MEFVGLPTWWELTLEDGGTLQIWADSLEETPEVLRFGCLVDASNEEQAMLKVAARTPSNPLRLIATFAEISGGSVKSWVSGP